MTKKKKKVDFMYELFLRIIIMLVSFAKLILPLIIKVPILALCHQIWVLQICHAKKKKKLSKVYFNVSVL